MMIYQVTLAIKPDYFEEFKNWLIEHVKEMLNFKGFKEAMILTNIDEHSKLIVQYCVESKEDLDDYLREQAKTMREKGLKRFGENFSAERAFFHVQSKMCGIELEECLHSLYS